MSGYIDMDADDAAWAGLDSCPEWMTALPPLNKVDHDGVEQP